ncbi:hypothetical protein JW766_02920 [Candidatus Dojkabacteria bacterium]|nr:hypothetical protein [Candidatus Dojkabacteria bacterium]
MATRKNLRPKKFILLTLIIFLLFGLIDVYLLVNNKKNTSKFDNVNTNYDLEDVFEAFIEEEAFIPEEHSVEEIERDTTVYLSGWIAYWDFNNAVSTYQENDEYIESLSPTWYYLKPDGSLGLKNTARNSNFIYLTKTFGTKIIPTISNSNADELSVVLNDDIFLNKHIEAITSEVDNFNFDGIDIDYEHIKAQDRDSFSNFIKLLSEKLHSNGKVLTIAILWKNNFDTVIENASESRKAQDWETLGKYVDEFRIMAYDYTGSGNSAGPIAPREWIRSILDYATDKVEGHKIVLGLPFYAYEWNEGVKGAKALAWTDVQRIKTSGNIISDELNSEFLEKELTYTIGDTTKVIWYQDSEVTQKRIKLAGTYGIYKFIFWRLGGEDPETFKEARN